MSSTGLGLLIYSKNKPLVYDFFNVGCLDNDVTEKNRQDIKKAGQLVYPAINSLFPRIARLNFRVYLVHINRLGIIAGQVTAEIIAHFPEEILCHCSIIMKMYSSATNSFQQVAFFTILLSRFHE